MSTPKRRRFTNIQRNFIACRQRWSCHYCEELLPAMFHLDHVNSLHRGGKDVLENLVACCPNCNSEKHTKELLDMYEDENICIVDRIDGHKRQSGRYLFQVIWADGSSTWEPVQHLEDCDAFKEYLNDHALVKRRLRTGRF